MPGRCWLDELGEEVLRGAFVVLLSFLSSCSQVAVRRPCKGRPTGLADDGAPRLGEVARSVLLRWKLFLL